MNKKVTAIIPVYNCEDYIKDCLDSILNQTYKNFEIIVVNDGSTDNTEKIVKKYAKRHKSISCITIKNSGQGYARNFALEKATGEYIMFIDADDFIEPVTFEVAVNRASTDNSDFVYLDYKYFFDNRQKYKYASKNKFFSKKSLIGDECLTLLKLKSYFTVNKLYRKDFLVKNNIKYGEFYIYEDIVFWLKCILNAKNISLIQSPLYNIRTTKTSTTKSNHNTDKHAKGFSKALEECVQVIKEKGNEEANKYFTNYIIKKFVIYYKIRTPRKYKKQFALDIYNSLVQINYDFKSLYRKSRFVKLLKKLRFVSDDDIFRLYINKIARKEVLKKEKKKKKNKVDSPNVIAYKKYSNDLKPQVLFMGFDFRYTGNSRYLFEEMLKKNKCDLYFVTEDEKVDEQYRIEPNTDEFYEKLYSSKIVIFESWINSAYGKPNDAIWINLWHGTPLKKMLFDSNEEEIVSLKPNHKITKYRAIEKMDYLLTDNNNVNHYFETSFLFNKDRLLSYGYPRVKYLIENKNNDKLKKEIRKKLNVSEDKKIISYVPTWRDYNYQDAEEYDFDYVLDKEKLEKNLSDDYVVLCKDHVFLHKNEDVPVLDIETQELLLVSDFVITDYSSIMFDAFALDVPVCLISKDFEKYSNSRGLYQDMWDDLKPFVTENEDDLAKMILEYKVNKDYKYIKDKYCYKSDGNLVKFIENKLKEEK